MECGMYVICVTSGSGLPVFTRSVGNVKQLPFPVIGSLNAVHMFAANHGAELQSTSTEDAKIVWKEYHQSLMLIAVVCGEGDPPTPQYVSLLDSVWDSLVLLCGLEEVTHIRNVERFKKEVKACYPLIDTLMSRVDLHVFSDLTSAVEGILAPVALGMQNCLEAFTEAACSPYGCLMVHGRVVVATEKWWNLQGQELVLLSLLTSSLSPCSSRDVPIYLPNLSPNVPHRLLTFSLTPYVEIQVICGPSPSLAQLDMDVGRFWVPAVQSLHAVRQLHPRNFPTHIELDNNILGFILVNTSIHHSVSSVNIRKDVREVEELRRRREILRGFYSSVTEDWLRGEEGEEDTSESQHSVIDTYNIYSSHKCYAHVLDNYQLFIMFSNKIPTYAMRNVCQKTLAAFIKDKSIMI